MYVENINIVCIVRRVLLLFALCTCEAGGRCACSARAPRTREGKKISRSKGGEIYLLT